MQRTIDYIIQFLTRDEHNSRLVGYTNDQTQWAKYKVVILPSDFFKSNTYGTPQSMPSLPLQEIEGIPLLFGTPQIETLNTTIICHADIIASTYFLISRYEEYINPTSNRDSHGRYIGKQSIPAKANFIHRPIIEEYGELLRKLLQQTNVSLPPIPQQINHIYLTHDVDSITNYRRLRGFLGGIYRSIFKHTESISTILKSFTNINNDPAYTFPWLLQQDNLLPQATQLYFIKSPRRAFGFDRPVYNLHGHNFQHLIKEIKSKSPNATFGLHASYKSGETPDIIIDEQKLLQYAIGNQQITTSRHHYLRSLQPTDMEALIDARITDDFTMGYADIAGFRLGTCRPVKFINPKTKRLTALTLHPLTIMDCSLSDPKYMNLSFSNALSQTKELIKQTQLHNGNLYLLWHNTIFSQNNYHKKLYSELIQLLK